MNELFSPSALASQVFCWAEMFDRNQNTNLVWSYALINQLWSPYGKIFGPKFWRTDRMKWGPYKKLRSEYFPYGTNNWLIRALLYSHHGYWIWGPYAFWEVHTALDGRRINQSNRELQSCYTIMLIIHVSTLLRWDVKWLNVCPPALLDQQYLSIWPQPKIVLYYPMLWYATKSSILSIFCTFGLATRLKCNVQVSASKNIKCQSATTKKIQVVFHIEEL